MWGYIKKMIRKHSTPSPIPIIVRIRVTEPHPTQQLNSQGCLNFTVLNVPCDDDQNDELPTKFDSRIYNPSPSYH